jgi:hypothetical protein
MSQFHLAPSKENPGANPTPGNSVVSRTVVVAVAAARAVAAAILGRTNRSKRQQERRRWIAEGFRVSSQNPNALRTARPAPPHCCNSSFGDPVASDR